ncbi:MAG: smalltalk protein [Prevotella sp.]|nr:smalltalk protein [Prevotella sp.]
MKKETWKQIIQIVITVLTAISSTVLVQSCGLLH